jgi:hypothetical protein
LANDANVFARNNKHEDAKTLAEATANPTLNAMIGQATAKHRWLPDWLS